MSNAIILNLLDPIAQKARRSFGEQRRRSTFSFNELYMLFTGSNRPVGDIATDAGVSRQALGATYTRYFMHLLGGVPCSERREAYEACLRRASTTKHAMRVFEKGRQLLKSDMMHHVVQKARKAGCVVRPNVRLVDGRAVHIEHHELIVNDHRCQVRSLKHTFTPNGSERPYVPASISLSTLERVKIIIFHTAPAGFPEQLFVIPCVVLLSVFFGSKPTKAKWLIYLPVCRNLGNNRAFPKMDYWEWENRWPQKAIHT